VLLLLVFDSQISSLQSVPTSLAFVLSQFLRREPLCSALLLLVVILVLELLTSLNSWFLARFNAPRIQLLLKHRLDSVLLFKGCQEGPLS